MTTRASGAHVLLQLRSGFAHEGGTWSCAGGALDEGERPYDGALREAAEEIGAVPEDHRLIGQYVFAPSNDWTYTTMVVAVGDTFGESANFETDAVAWVHIDHVDRKALHPGFAAAWPQVRKIITNGPDSGYGPDSGSGPDPVTDGPDSVSGPR